MVLTYRNGKEYKIEKEDLISIEDYREILRSQNILSKAQDIFSKPNPLSTFNNRKIIGDYNMYHGSFKIPKEYKLYALSEKKRSMFDYQGVDLVAEKDNKLYALDFKSSLRSTQLAQFSNMENGIGKFQTKNPFTSNIMTDYIVTYAHPHERTFRMLPLEDFYLTFFKEIDNLMNVIPLMTDLKGIEMSKNRYMDRLSAIIYYLNKDLKPGYYFEIDNNLTLHIKQGYNE